MLFGVVGMFFYGLDRDTLSDLYFWLRLFELVFRLDHWLLIY